jgi:hypothetical protein
MCLQRSPAELERWQLFQRLCPSIYIFVLLAMAAVLAVAALWEVRYKTEVPLIKMVNLSFCYSNVPFHIGIDPF